MEEYKKIKNVLSSDERDKKLFEAYLKRGKNLEWFSKELGISLFQADWLIQGIQLKMRKQMIYVTKKKE